MDYVLGAIPLSRPAVASFLEARNVPAKGRLIQTIAQRPTADAEKSWLQDLRSAQDNGDVTVEMLLALDDPHAYLATVPTDRLVPARFVEEAGFLTRNLGGWAPVLFDVFGFEPADRDDPVVAHLETLVAYGPRINAVTSDPQLTASRLEDEVGGGPAEAAAAILAVADAVEASEGPAAAVQSLVSALHGEHDRLRNAPAVVLFDALLGILVRVESQRRACAAEMDEQNAERLAGMQAVWRDEHGLTLILKGEYIAGRHRRSTVLIAPELGVVVKQPAPEPEHEISVGDRVIDGRLENWPRPVDDGALVTSRGRLRMMLSDGAMPKLTAALGYNAEFCSLLGLTVEPHVQGVTLQEVALEDPDRLTPQVYESIAQHQQVCEVLGVDNADWHAANFMVRSDGSLVHVDWGAARTLRDEEKTPQGERQRLDQVRNIAYSFQDERLAERVDQLHRQLLEDPEALARIRTRAQKMAEN